LLQSNEQREDQKLHFPMKRTNCFFVIICIALMFMSCGDEQGTLKGDVQFMGLPCQPGQPDYRVPPCTGPFPSYEIAVFDPDNLEEPVMTTTTAKNGKYQLTLAVGEYIIMTQAGPRDQDQRENRFRIEKDQVTVLNLAVNTGIL
jgi:hypothetical protein